jgi:thiosulfate/3-mercaptopyruvate sulfurtransferase
MESLVSTEWLANELAASDLRIIDATSFLPGDPRDARAEYEAGHAPGAVFGALDEIADSSSSLPGMMPPAHQFASRLQALGVGDGDRIVVYDNSPLHSAARLWWMLRSFGARHAALLDGGLQKWIAERRPLERCVPVPRRAHFTAALDPVQLADKAQVRAIVGAGTHELVDARSVERFAGEVPEPRPGLVAGHIPGSRSLPTGRLFNADNSWKQGGDLRAAFEEAGVDLQRPIIATCGSGVTAAVLLFGAHLLGKDDVRLYDGSWTEWGSDPSTPKATGRA